MIRVLQVFGRMDRGGAESMIMNLYRNIDRSKVQFDFVVHTQDKCEFDDEILSLGGRIYSVPRFNAKNALIYKKAWKKLLNDHLEWQIVHGHIMSTASIFLKIAHNIGRYTISHSHIAGKDHRITLASVIKSLLEKHIKADYYLACSNAAGLWLFGEDVVTSENYSVLPNAIDTMQFQFDSDCRTKVRKSIGVVEQVLLGHIGRFDEQKNHSFVVDVFSAIKKKNPNVKLMLVGDGSLRGDIEDQAKTMGINDDIIFTGVRSDVNELLQAMDCFVFPSKYEGLGVVLIEAQTSGLPCVMSDRVPDEAIVTSDLVSVMSLDKSVDEWADHILLRLGKERYSHVEEIKAAGYDISDTSKWLEGFYLSKADEMRR